MPEYLAPGVYVEEVSSGNKPIAGVGTSTAGFVGATERGPLAPQFISSWLDFQRWYGSYIEDSYLAYAVEGFFMNGGQRCFVGRVVGGSAESATAVFDGKLNIVAIGPGAWGDKIGLTIEQASGNDNWCKATLTYAQEREVYDNLTLKPGASNNLAKVINHASRLVRVWLEEGLAEDAMLAFSDTNDQGSVPTLLLGGKDSEQAVGKDDFAGAGNPIPVPETAGPTKPDSELLGRSHGLSGLALIDEIAIVVVPDQARDHLYDTVTSLVIAQCETLKDRFAILSAKRGESDANTLRPPADTSYAGFYYPWITVFDPVTNGAKLVPASGHIAGIFARTDIERGVHKAPANEVVRGVLDLEFPVTQAMQNLLNPRGVNCMRDFRSDGRGLRLWGARTMSSDQEWRYVNVRRLFFFVEESIDEGTQWVVFEPNDDSTWAKVRHQVTNFLISVWRSGALMGLTQDEAFFVACDRTTMTQDDIDNGRLICVIGIAPVKPAEFVIFRISQKTADFAG